MTGQDKYAVFGNPIKQSKSPAIHAAFAEQCGQSIQYRAVRVELDGLLAIRLLTCPGKSSSRKSVNRLKTVWIGIT